jgi:hypothetical protein
MFGPAAEVERTDEGLAPEDVNGEPIYKVLRHNAGFLSMEQIMRRLPAPIDVPTFERI